jgi:glycosyltransferase involved in cell wall biosynthesis
MPKLSILIPLYNAEKYIAQTIESVLNQTFEDWELIVLDDCSTDNSYEIAKSYESSDKRITVKKNTQNLGMMGNWNEGIKYCHSEYFVKLDADDLWHPNLLAESIEILDKMPEVALIFTKYINIDEEGNAIKNSEITLPDFAQNKAFSCVPLVQTGVDKMLSYSILRQGLSVMRRKVFDEIGTYRYLLTLETQASTDTAFYFRVGCHYQIYCIDKPYYYYRVHTQSISSTDKNQGLQAQKMYEVKSVIVDYYYQQGKISHQTKNKFQQQIKFEYFAYLVYAYRVKKSYLKMFYFLGYNLLFTPTKTIQFYLKRISNKNE